MKRNKSPEINKNQKAHTVLENYNTPLQNPSSKLQIKQLSPCLYDNN